MIASVRAALVLFLLPMLLMMSNQVTARSQSVATPIPALLNSPAPTPGAFAGLIDVGGGRKMFLECRGEGSPAVVLVSGYRNTADVWDSEVIAPEIDQAAVLPGVAQFTRVCAYDRPGTVLDAVNVSRSDPVAQPQTAADAVADLHALFSAAGISAPYVLVGHSYGGQVVRLFASVHPNDVAGLVLVDALPAVEQWLTPAQWTAYQELLNQRPNELSAYGELETVDFTVSAVQVHEAAPLPTVPLVVLSRGLRPEFPRDLPPGFSIDALEHAWAAGQNELAALVPQARHVSATRSGHAIQLEQPELVIAAVRQVVAAVRVPGTWTENEATPGASPGADVNSAVG
jgi:pimeloyl-ACP methyl ester carboxylesterase